MQQRASELCERDFPCFCSGVCGHMAEPTRYNHAISCSISSVESHVCYGMHVSYMQHLRVQILQRLGWSMFASPSTEPLSGVCCVLYMLLAITSGACSCCRHQVRAQALVKVMQLRSQHQHLECLFLCLLSCCLLVCVHLGAWMCETFASSAPVCHYVRAYMCTSVFLRSPDRSILVWICICSVSSSSMPNETVYSPMQQEPAKLLISLLAAPRKLVFQ